MTPAVLRQQMGHSAAGMTARYTGEILSNKSGLHFAQTMAPNHSFGEREAVGKWPLYT
jgi:hypothetical protein